jgi:hypothetical protein
MKRKEGTKQVYTASYLLPTQEANESIYLLVKIWSIRSYAQGEIL